MSLVRGRWHQAPYPGAAFGGTLSGITERLEDARPADARAAVPERPGLGLAPEALRLGEALAVAAYTRGIEDSAGVAEPRGSYFGRRAGNME